MLDEILEELEPPHRETRHGRRKRK
jgi:hypothetical protein